jgi:hypothetical protein
MEKYNGWSNYATWNVALWMFNDETWYRLACMADNYDHFVRLMVGNYRIHETPDGIDLRVMYGEYGVNRQELNEAMAELHDDDDDDDELPYDDEEEYSTYRYDDYTDTDIVA